MPELYDAYYAHGKTIIEYYIGTDIYKLAYADEDITQDKDLIQFLIEQDSEYRLEAINKLEEIVIIKYDEEFQDFSHKEQIIIDMENFVKSAISKGYEVKIVK